MMHLDNIINYLFLFVLGITVVRAEIYASQRNKCLEDGIFPDLSDCTRFYMCSSGKKTLFQCPAMLRFNPDILVCDWPINVVCLNDIPTEGLSLVTKNAETTTAASDITSKMEHVVATTQAILATEYVETFPHSDSTTNLVKDQPLSNDVTSTVTAISHSGAQNTSIKKEINEGTGGPVIETTEATTEKNIATNEDPEYPNIDETTVLFEEMTSQDETGVTNSTDNDENFVTHVTENAVHTAIADIEMTRTEANDIATTRDHSWAPNHEESTTSEGEIVTEEIATTKSTQMGDARTNSDEIIPDDYAMNEGISEKTDAAYEYFIANEDYSETEMLTEDTTNDGGNTTEDGDNKIFTEGLVTTIKPIIERAEDEHETYTTEDYLTSWFYPISTSSSLQRNDELLKNTSEESEGRTNDTVDINHTNQEGMELVTMAEEEQYMDTTHINVQTNVIYVPQNVFNVEESNVEERLAKSTSNDKRNSPSTTENAEQVKAETVKEEPEAGSKDVKIPQNIMVVQDKVINDNASAVAEKTEKVKNSGKEETTEATTEKTIATNEDPEYPNIDETTVLFEEITSQDETGIKTRVTNSTDIAPTTTDHSWVPNHEEGTTSEGKIVTGEIAITKSTQMGDARTNSDEIIPDDYATNEGIPKKTDAAHEYFIVNEDYSETEMLTEDTTNDGGNTTEDGDNKIFTEGLVTTIKPIIGRAEDEHETYTTEDDLTSWSYPISTSSSLQRNDELLKKTSEGPERRTNDTVDINHTNQEGMELVTLVEEEEYVDTTHINVPDENEVTEKFIKSTNVTYVPLKPQNVFNVEESNVEERLTKSTSNDERNSPSTTDIPEQVKAETVKEEPEAGSKDVKIPQNIMVVQDKVINDNASAVAEKSEEVESSGKEGTTEATIEKTIATNEDPEYPNIDETTVLLEEITSQDETGIKTRVTNSTDIAPTTRDHSWVPNHEEGTTSEGKIVSEEIAITKSTKMGDARTNSDEIIPDDYAMNEGISEKTDAAYEYVIANEDYSETEILTKDTTNDEGNITEDGYNKTFTEGLVTTTKPIIGRTEDEHETYTTEDDLTSWFYPISTSSSLQRNDELLKNTSEEFEGQTNDTIDVNLTNQEKMELVTSKEEEEYMDTTHINVPYENEVTEELIKSTNVIYVPQNVFNVEESNVEERLAESTSNDERNSPSTTEIAEKVKAETVKEEAEAGSKDVKIPQNIVVVQDKVINGNASAVAEKSEKVDNSGKEEVVFMKKDLPTVTEEVIDKTNSNLMHNVSKDESVLSVVVIMKEIDSTVTEEPVELLSFPDVEYVIDEEESHVTEGATEDREASAVVEITGKEELVDAADSFITKGGSTVGERLGLATDSEKEDPAVTKDVDSTASDATAKELSVSDVKQTDDSEKANALGGLSESEAIIDRQNSTKGEVVEGVTVLMSNEEQDGAHLTSSFYSITTSSPLQRYDESLNNTREGSQGRSNDTVDINHMNQEGMELVTLVDEEEHMNTTHNNVPYEDEVTKKLIKPTNMIYVDQKPQNVFNVEESNVEERLAKLTTNDERNNPSTTEIDEQVKAETVKEESEAGSKNVKIPQNIVVEQDKVINGNASAVAEKSGMVENSGKREAETFVSNVKQAIDPTKSSLMNNASKDKSVSSVVAITKEIDPTVTEELLPCPDVDYVIDEEESHVMEGASEDRKALAAVEVIGKEEFADTADSFITKGDTTFGERLGLANDSEKDDPVITKHVSTVIEETAKEFLVSNVLGGVSESEAIIDRQNSTEGEVGEGVEVLMSEEGQDAAHLTSWIDSVTTSSSLQRYDESSNNTRGGAQGRTNDTVDINHMNQEGMELGIMVEEQENMGTTHNNVPYEDEVTEKLIKPTNMIYVAQKPQSVFNVGESKNAEERFAKSTLIKEESKAGSKNVKILQNIVVVQDKVINEDVSVVAENSGKVENSEKEEAVFIKKDISNVTEKTAQQTSVSNVKQVIDKTKSNLMKNVSKDESVLSVVEISKVNDSTVTEDTVEVLSFPDLEHVANEEGSHVSQDAGQDREALAVVEVTGKEEAFVVADSFITKGNSIAGEGLRVSNDSKEVDPIITKDVESTVTEEIVRELSVPDVKHKADTEKTHVTSDVSENEVIIDGKKFTKGDEIVEEMKVLMSKEEPDGAHSSPWFYSIRTASTPLQENDGSLENTRERSQGRTNNTVNINHLSQEGIELGTPVDEEEYMDTTYNTMPSEGAVAKEPQKSKNITYVPQKVQNVFDIEKSSLEELAKATPSDQTESQNIIEVAEHVEAETAEEGPEAGSKAKITDHIVVTQDKVINEDAPVVVEKSEKIENSGNEEAVVAKNDISIVTDKSSKQMSVTEGTLEQLSFSDVERVIHTKGSHVTEDASEDKEISTVVDKTKTEEVITKEIHSTVTGETVEQLSFPDVERVINEEGSFVMEDASDNRETSTAVDVTEKKEVTKEIYSTVAEQIREQLDLSDMELVINKNEGASEDIEASTVAEITEKGGAVAVAESFSTKGHSIIGEKLGLSKDPGKVEPILPKHVDSAVIKEIAKESSAPNIKQKIDSTNVIGDLNDNEVIIDRQNFTKGEIVEEMKVLMSKDESDGDSKVKNIHERGHSAGDEQESLCVNDTTSYENEVVENSMKTQSLSPEDVHQEMDSIIAVDNTEEVVLATASSSSDTVKSSTVETDVNAKVAVNEDSIIVIEKGDSIGVKAPKEGKKGILGIADIELTQAVDNITFGEVNDRAGGVSFEVTVAGENAAPIEKSGKNITVLGKEENTTSENVATGQITDVTKLEKAMPSKEGSFNLNTKIENDETVVSEKHSLIEATISKEAGLEETTKDLEGDVSVVKRNKYSSQEITIAVDRESRITSKEYDNVEIYDYYNATKDLDAKESKLNVSTVENHDIEDYKREPTNESNFKEIISTNSNMKSTTKLENTRATIVEGRLTEEAKTIFDRETTGVIQETGRPEVYKIVEKKPELENSAKEVAADMVNMSKGQLDNAIDEKWSIFALNSTNPSTTAFEKKSVTMDGYKNVGTIDKYGSTTKDVEKKVENKPTTIDKYTETKTVQTKAEPLNNKKYPNVAADTTEVIGSRIVESKIANQTPNPTLPGVVIMGSKNNSVGDNKHIKKSVIFMSENSTNKELDTTINREGYITEPVRETNDKEKDILTNSGNLRDIFRPDVFDTGTKTSISNIEHSKNGQSEKTVARDRASSIDARMPLTNNSVENSATVEDNVIQTGYSKDNEVDKGASQDNVLMLSDTQNIADRHYETMKLESSRNIADNKTSLPSSSGTQNDKNRDDDQISQIFTKNAIEQLSSSSDLQDNDLQGILPPSYGNENAQERESLPDGTTIQNTGNQYNGYINAGSTTERASDTSIISSNVISQRYENGDQGYTQEDEYEQSKNINIQSKNLAVQGNQPFRGDTSPYNDAGVDSFSSNLVNIAEQFLEWDTNHGSTVSTLKVAVEPRYIWEWDGLESKERKDIKHEMKETYSKDEFKKKKHELNTMLEEKKQNLISSSEERGSTGEKKRGSSEEKYSKKKSDKKENKVQKKKKEENDNSTSEEVEKLSSIENSPKNNIKKENSKKKDESNKQKKKDDSLPSSVEAIGSTKYEINSKDDSEKDKHKTANKKGKKKLKMSNTEEGDSKENVTIELDSKNNSSASTLKVSVDPRYSWEDILNKWDDLNSKERKDIKHEMKEAYSKDEFKKKEHELNMLLKEKKQNLISSSEESVSSSEKKRGSSEEKSSKKKSVKKKNKIQKKKKEGNGNSTSEEDEELSSRGNSSKDNIKKEKSKEKEEAKTQKKKDDSIPSSGKAIGPKYGINSKEDDSKKNKHKTENKKGSKKLKISNTEERESKENVTTELDSKNNSSASTLKVSVDPRYSWEDILNKWDDLNSKEMKDMKHKMKKAYSKDELKKKKHELNMLLREKKQSLISSSEESGSSSEKKRGSSEEKSSKKKSDKKKNKIQKKKKEENDSSTSEEDEKLSSRGNSSKDNIEKEKSKEKEEAKTQNKKDDSIPSSGKAIGPKYGINSKEDDSKKNKHKTENKKGSKKLKISDTEERASKENVIIELDSKNNSSASTLKVPDDPRYSWEDILNKWDDLNSKERKDIKHEMKEAYSKDEFKKKEHELNILLKEKKQNLISSSEESVSSSEKKRGSSEEKSSKKKSDKKKNKIQKKKKEGNGNSTSEEDEELSSKENTSKNNIKKEKSNEGRDRTLHDDRGSNSNEQKSQRDKSRNRSRNRQNIRSLDEEDDSEGQTFEIKAENGVASEERLEWSENISSNRHIRISQKNEVSIDKDAECMNNNTKEDRAGNSRCRRRSSNSDRNRRNSRRDGRNSEQSTEEDRRDSRNTRKRRREHNRQSSQRERESTQEKNRS